MKEVIDWCAKRQVNLNDYTMFALIRNPWSRVVSHYKYMRIKSQIYGQHVRGETDMVDLMLNQAAIKYSKNCYDFFTANKINSFIRWANVTHDKRKHLPNYTDLLTHNGVELDCIGRTENSQPFMDQMCDRLKMPRVKLQKLNTTNVKPYWKYYDAHTQNLVGELYHEDIIKHKFKYK